MAKSFTDTPLIFGVLCDGVPKVPKGMERSIKEKIPEAVLLPFHVEPRHLKNVVRCMQLMDVMGLVVIGDHRKRMTRHIRALDASAKTGKMVDVIVRKGKNFRGYSTEQIALSKWAKATNKMGANMKQPPPSELKRLIKEISVELLTESPSSN